VLLATYLDQRHEIVKTKERRRRTKLKNHALQLWYIIYAYGKNGFERPTA
jgi:hypothetical protein